MSQRYFCSAGMSCKSTFYFTDKQDKACNYAVFAFDQKIKCEKMQKPVDTDKH